MDGIALCYNRDGQRDGGHGPVERLRVGAGAGRHGRGCLLPGVPCRSGLALCQHRRTERDLGPGGGGVLCFRLLAPRVTAPQRNRLIVTKAAEIDLDESFVWYEKQKEELGFAFILEFEKTLNKIMSNPFYPSLIEDDARSASLKRFPYTIIYRILTKQLQVRIIAVIHQHRDPEWIRTRL